jgi:hypothetical protein
MNYPRINKFIAAELTKKFYNILYNEGSPPSERGDEPMRTHNWTSFWVRWVQSTQHSVSSVSSLLASSAICLGLPSGVFAIDLSTDTFVLISFSTSFIKFSCVSLPHLPVTSVLSDPNIPLFPDTCSLCSYPQGGTPSCKPATYSIIFPWI